jgi:hypothetical protein
MSLAPSKNRRLWTLAVSAFVTFHFCMPTDVTGFVVTDPQRTTATFSVSRQYMVATDFDVGVDAINNSRSARRTREVGVCFDPLTSDAIA